MLFKLRFFMRNLMETNERLLLSKGSSTALFYWVAHLIASVMACLVLRGIVVGMVYIYIFFTHLIFHNFIPSHNFSATLILLKILYLEKNNTVIELFDCFYTCLFHVFQGSNRVKAIVLNEKESISECNIDGLSKMNNLRLITHIIS
ncbi:hypothetical protein V8G54_001079 [Vigna mungo]|uniref:Uncharacterized protein n=1 Tax=Vigna mungo TaxID=3915 RepID=A0AAQ3P7N7_VIGMU